LPYPQYITVVYNCGYALIDIASLTRADCYTTMQGMKAREGPAYRQAGFFIRPT